LKQEDISQIVATARGVDRVRELVASLGDERLVAKFIDLSDIKCAAKVLKGADVVVNCSHVSVELPATKAALEAGVNYAGTVGRPPEPEQLALSDEFKRKGILAIPGIGGAAGLVQVMAAYAINKLDRTDSVDIKSGSRDLVPPEEHTRPLAWGPRVGGKGEINLDYPGLDTVRGMYVKASVSYEDGELRWNQPRGNSEVFQFREPIGALTIAQSSGGAVVSLSRSFPGINRITYKTGGDPDQDRKKNFLRDLGFMDEKPINVQGQMVSPWEVLVTLLGQPPPETKPADIRDETRVIVRGEEAGKEVEYNISRLNIDPDRFKEYIGLSTGLCSAIAAVMIGRGQIKAKGVLMPELCIPPDRFLDELASLGMDIEITKTVKL
jgi:lysine 6-dehydrogenase